MAREQRQLTLEDAERTTLIRQKILSAFEEENVAQLPPFVYARGLLKIYAEYLNLDANEMVRLLEQTYDLPKRYGVIPATKRISTNSPFTPALFVTIIILLGLSLLLLYLYQEYSSFVSSSGGVGTSATQPSGTVTSVAVLPTATPTATPWPSPTATPTPYPGVTIEAKIVDRTWLRVIVDGVMVFQGILEPGMTMTWAGKDKVFIRTGNAGGVEITHNGKKRGLMGSRGEVLDREWTRAQPAEGQP